MNFKSVFRSLQEVFPQVDIRILKAVAIEHSKDVDAAVEFVLLEVLPSLGGSSEASYTIQEMEEPSAKVGVNIQAVSLEHQGVEEMNTSLLSGQNSVACGSASSDDHTTSAYIESPCVGEAVVEGPYIGYVSDPKEPCPLMPYHEGVKVLNASLPSEEKSIEHEMDLISDHKDEAFHIEPQCSASTKAGSSLSNVHNGNSHDQVISNSATEKLCLVENIFFSRLGLAENGYDALHANAELYGLEVNGAVSSVHTNAQNPSPFPVATPCLMEYGAVKEKDTNSSVSECEEQLLQCTNMPTLDQDLIGFEASGAISAAFTSALDMSSSVLENHPDFMNIGAEVHKNLNNPVTENEEPQSGCLAENYSGSFASETKMVPIDDFSLPTTRSGHVISIDFLEEFIADAKNNKKTLASSVETVSSMMKEVELLEGRAIQAKEEASTAGQDILIKVQELKQMLKHAMEANNMHAGEVYGERAILATEARELQSRLLSMSNERNKSLSIIEEIRGTLEARLALAEEEIAAAEQEKLEKEELARKVLNEQEVSMNTIVEESKKLQEEATENAKLREFLMDRGRIVDMLQGEIAVICEDVFSLKERVAGGVALGRSLRSSSTSSLASSLSSSFRRSMTLSDRALNPVELGESPRRTNDVGDLETQQQLRSNGDGVKEIYAGGEQKMLSDDDWEIFDAES